MGSQGIQIPVLFQDLRREESLQQAIDALENLEQVVTNIFGTISNRVSKEKQRLEAVQSRYSATEARISKLALFSNKATKVHSPAKYPTPEKFDGYTPMWGSDQVTSSAPRHVWHKLNESVQLPVTVKETLFHDMLNESNSLEKTSENVQNVEGLGRIPNHLGSLASLLLFNTQENPYKKYTGLDNLAGVSGLKEKVVTKKEMTAAPVSVAEGEQLNLTGGENMDYKPVLGEVPEFHFPNQIPNLPMVASDLSYLESQKTMIAPSGQTVPLSGTLPTVSATPSTPAVSQATAAALPPVTQTATPAKVDAPPPPPAPAPPPPPAAPQPPKPPTTATPAPPPPADAPAAVANPDGGRNSLLDDIKKGHMNRLKKVQLNEDGEPAPASAPKRQEEKTKKKEEPSGDMMTDLMTALKRRRNNMGGKAEPKKKDEAIAMPEESEWD